MRKFSENEINGVKVGMNVIEGMGIGFCVDKEDVERMKCWMMGVNIGYDMGFEFGREVGMVEGKEELVSRIVEEMM